MSMPWKPIVPASLPSIPEIKPIRVVLPAPFGPMRACTSPAATSSVTPSTATTPPKRLLRFLSESTGDSAGREQHHREQDHAHRQLPVERVGAEQRAAREDLLEDEEHGGADRAAP